MDVECDTSSDAYDDVRYLTELGYTKSPDDILALVRKSKPLSLKFLDGYETCGAFTSGKILGKGKSGTVYDIKEQNLDGDNDGLRVVIKEFVAKEAPRYNNGVYVLSSSLNDIVMSSLFHSFYAGDTKDHSHSITFPYFEGFFVCGSKGYAVTEKLEMTLSKFIDSDVVSAENFRVILFQVLFSLKFLNKEKVMHNDLHAKNVMIRYAKDISYRGAKLEEAKNFTFKSGRKEYTHKNVGIIAKIVDFDFAAKYGEPTIVADKVYRKREDKWNLIFRFGPSYDMLTFVAYMAYYVIVKTPQCVTDGKMSVPEWLEIQRTVESAAEFIVERAETTIGHIGYRRHLKKDGGRESVSLTHNKSKYCIANETEENRTCISKLMDMVSVPMYRPYEKYCHLDLTGILEIDAFRHFRNNQNSESALVVGLQ